MINIIPYPAEMVEADGFFRIESKLAISSCSKADYAVEILKDLLSENLKEFSLDDNCTQSIIFKENSKLNNEQYTLKISSSSISIAASSEVGFLYAIQSLRQLVACNGFEKKEYLTLDCLEINDYPRFGWRGFMLDEARHFFGATEVKRILDLMCLHKLNIFHWHLSDDQGFRIESKVFPLLHEIGSTRSDTQVGGWSSKKYRGIEHGGYYTQNEIKEIVAYASQRGITIVPEIDIPAHFSAILAAYPKLSCTGEQIAVMSNFGPTKLVACAGSKSTYDFLYKLLDELCTLFPSPYIHIGGDEAPDDLWKTCPNCQKVMQDKGYENTRQLQTYMMNKLAKRLAKNGRTTICWSEVCSDDMDKNIVSQYWTAQKNKACASAMENGAKFIISRQPYAYFDYPYASLPIKKCYSFEPILEEFGDKEVAEKSILGIEAPLWTEWVYDREKIDFNIFPRLSAISETGWTKKENKDYKCFNERWQQFKKILDDLDVNYAKDNIATPKSCFVRSHDLRLWFRSDQYSEVRRNRK